MDSIKRIKAILFATALAMSLGSSPSRAGTVTVAPPVPAGTTPTAIAIDPIHKSLAVTDRDSNSVFLFSTDTPQLPPAFARPTGSRPGFAAINPELGVLYIGNEGDGTLSVYETRHSWSELHAAQAIQVAGPTAINPYANRAYMLRESAGDEFNVIDVLTFKQADAIRSFAPVGLAFNPATNRLFIATEASGDVVPLVMDSDTDFPRRECPDGSGGIVPDSGATNPSPPPCIDVPGFPVSVAVNPVTNRAYALTSTSQIVEIQGPNMTWTAYSVPQAGAPAGPTAIAVNPVTNKVYALFANQVVVMDGATHAMTNAIAGAGRTSVGMVVDVALDLVYVVNDNGGLTWFQGDGSAGTFGVAIPPGAIGIVLDPLTHKAYVASPSGVSQVTNSGFTQVVAMPLRAVPRPLVGNMGGPTGTVVIDASSSMTPAPLDRIRKVYYRYTRVGLQPAGELLFATDNGDGTWDADYFVNSPGAYFMEVFAVNGLEADVINTDKVHVPVTSVLSRYDFTVAPPGSVNAPLIKAIRHADFNGDGRDDLLWHNNTGNQSAGWLMNGTQIQDGRVLAYPPQIPGTNETYRDSVVVAPLTLDADGKTDLLWESPGMGEEYIAALMDGLDLRTSSSVLINHNQFVFDLGDFDGDGKTDLLISNSSMGGYYVQLMDGIHAKAQSPGRLNPDGLTDGHPALVADLDGDGRSDIVFVNSDGSVIFCRMVGVDCASSGFIRPSGNTFVPVAAGDFNGDGRIDIVWQAPDGTTSLWLMNGASQIDSAAILAPGTGWHVVAAPDMNGDGRADLLFQHDDGSYAGWLMNGLQPIAYRALFGGGTGWHFVKAADLNGDRKDDLIWRHEDGRYGPWLMNGLDVYAYGAFFGPGTGWEIIR